MARNRHPERTRARILDVAKRLFLTKGYDGTTMQDIVDSLGDLSKGAVYYHFKSKEAILDALGEEDQSRHDPMAIDDTGLTGLDKLREAFRRSAADNEHMRLMNAAYPAMHDPKLLAANLKVWRTQVADMFDAMIREGVADGSIDTAYPREAAELLALLTNYWLAPTFYPATADELHHRVEALATVCTGLGVPILDKDLIETVSRGYAALID